MELHADVHGAVGLQEAGGTVAVVRDFAVAVVVQNDQVVGFGVLNHLLEVLNRCDATRGVVRVVEPEDLSFVCNLGRDVV